MFLKLVRPTNIEQITIYLIIGSIPAAEQQNCDLTTNLNIYFKSGKAYKIEHVLIPS